MLMPLNDGQHSVTKMFILRLMLLTVLLAFSHEFNADGPAFSCQDLSSDVTRLVKIRQLRISTSRICQTRMQITLYKHLFYQSECNSVVLCQLNDCDDMLFLNVR